MSHYFTSHCGHCTQGIIVFITNYLGCKKDKTVDIERIQTVYDTSCILYYQQV